MDLIPNSNESRTAEALIRDMARSERCPCSNCSVPLCSHQVLMNLVLGFKDSPRCLACLAAALDQDVEPFRDYLINYLQQQECHKTAWAWANSHEIVTAGLPICMASASEKSSVKTPEVMGKRTGNHSLSASSLPGREEKAHGQVTFDTVWDAGDMGCGDLVLELRLRLQAMQPGQIIKLCARDPGAPHDLPAWSRLTGHLLLRAEHPNYWIKRKE
jgi:tRNA 2-thiouridine synthesizing protein A